MYFHLNLPIGLTKCNIYVHVIYVNITCYKLTKNNHLETTLFLTYVNVIACDFQQRLCRVSLTYMYIDLDKLKGRLVHYLLNGIL